MCLEGVPYIKRMHSERKLEEKFTGRLAIKISGQQSGSEQLHITVDFCQESQELWFLCGGNFADISA
jgi:hypothetical protein